MSGQQIVRLATVVGFMVLPAIVWAQTAASGAIAGVVRDTTGAVLPGVTVEAASPALIEKLRTVVTDGQGQYKIVELRPGTYTVTFSLAGFSLVKREDLELTAGFTATVNADLQVGSLEETITVSGASPVVDTQNVRSQKVLSRESLDTLPTGRTIQGYAALTVGVTASTAGHDVGGSQSEAIGHIIAHGSRSGDGALNIDGMTFNNTFGSLGGSTRQYFVNQAAAKEIVLDISGMTAETETGGVSMNVVPKDGGNTFTVYVNGNGTNGNLQSSNLTDVLRARGVATEVKVKRIYDIGGGLGGPIRRDKLWFYTAHRLWGAQNYAPGNFYNKTHGTMFYTPDLSRPAFLDIYERDHSLRLTWQASPRHKFTLSDSNQKSCHCNYYVQLGTSAPDAAVDYTYWPVYLAQSTWTFPATNRLLVEAGWTYLHNMTAPRQAPGVLPSDISIIEQSRNYMYNAYTAASLNVAQPGQRHFFPQHNERFSVSYVTGSHAFKTGLFTMSGRESYGLIEVNQDLTYIFRNQVPVLLTQWASPTHQEMKLKLDLGLYAQDQWTLKRLTLNLGVRFDYLNAYVPAQHRPAGRFVSAFDFARIDNLPNYTDLSPRLGAAYDLFGNGKTALKVSLGRYVQALGTTIARNVNPANTIVGRADRTWNDANGNYVPDCDLYTSVANGECGPLSANGFGTVRVVTRYDPNLLEGFGVRGNNWNGSVSVQHELKPGTALTVGYFRRSYANFTVTDNQPVTPADYDPYCITAPKDSRLPGGGGNQLCGLYDVKREKFGQVDNLVTLASNFGKQTDVFDGVDVAINARLGQGVRIAGGMATGRQVTDNCFAVDSPQQARPGYCHISPPWGAGTQFKVNGIYPLPWWDLQTSATFESLPGVAIGANYAASNAEIAPALGRNLSACAAPTGVCTATAVIDIVPPQTMFEDRLNQLDIRFTKIVRLGRARLQGMFDIYNIFNASTVLGVSTRYGATTGGGTWLLPSQILSARLFKLGAQFDF